MKFIFEIRMKPGHAAGEYADIWVRASEIIQKAPGAKGTFLHRRLGEPGVLLAIAHWESKAQRDAKHDGEAVRAILAEAAPICDIRVLGEFDEPEWTVLPG